MIPIKVPPGDTLRQRRVRARQILADIVRMNPVKMELFRECQKIIKGLDILIKASDKELKDGDKS